MLDTPLLTYREPLTSKDGDLSADQVEILKTGLAKRFYDQLSSLKDVAQFIVIENKDVADDDAVPLPVKTFTANPNSGRYESFPPRKTGEALRLRPVLASTVKSFCFSPTTLSARST